MKKTILGLLAAAALVGGAATMAEAKTNFSIHLGVPYYDYQVGPDYRYHRSYGWYRPGYVDQGFRNRLSCNEARQAVRERGYRNVVAQECSGRTYTFNATRNNRRIQLFVNSRTGAVFRG
jgi:hypothetical protein